jgi:hypothetical protein
VDFLMNQFLQNGPFALKRVLETLSGDNWTCSYNMNEISVIFRRRISMNFCWRPLHYWAATVPNEGLLALLRVPLAGFQQVYNPTKTIYQEYLVELADLPKFRDAVVDFYDDLGFLMMAGFEAPTADSIRDNTVMLTCARTVGLVAIIDQEGMTIEFESLALFAKVSQQFRDILGGDRRMFRRAMQLMVGITRFEISMVVAVCEIINETQSQTWKGRVRWTDLFDDVVTDGERQMMAFTLPIGVNLIGIEIAKVAGKVQVAVTCRGMTRKFAILRSVIQLMAGCDADLPFLFENTPRV